MAQARSCGSCSFCPHVNRTLIRSAENLQQISDLRSEIRSETLTQAFHPWHTEKERGSGHTSSPQLNSTVCIESFISLLGSVLWLKGSYRSSLCYWCQCQRISKDAERAWCYLFKYRQRQAHSDWAWKSESIPLNNISDIVVLTFPDRFSQVQSTSTRHGLLYGNWNPTPSILICGLECLAELCVVGVKRVRLQHKRFYQRDINHGMNYKGATHYCCQDKNRRENKSMLDRESMNDQYMQSEMFYSQKITIIICGAIKNYAADARTLNVSPPCLVYRCRREVSALNRAWQQHTKTLVIKSQAHSSLR